MKLKETTKIIIIFIIVITMVKLIPQLDNSFVKADKLYINEILVKNTYSHLDNDNEYSDYIEIYNGYKHEINLNGYHLSDNEFETNKWTFPNITIKPKEYLIVYASGKDKCDNNTKICHTNFKLSSNGEVLTLTDSSNNIINKFTYYETSNDVSFGYSKGKYYELEKPTPRKKNANILKRVDIKDYNIYINEYMSHNTGTTYIDNNYYDFIELYNDSDKDLNLNNLYLTDNIDELTKYKLPDITINKKSYFLIYLGDISKVIDNQVIANFKLSDTDKHIVLSNGKKIIDKVELVILPDNVSYGKKDGRWYYFSTATPGYDNNTIGYSSLGGSS